MDVVTIECSSEKVCHYPDVESRGSSVEVAESVWVNSCCGSSTRGGEVTVSEVVDSSVEKQVIFPLKTRLEEFAYRRKCA